MLKCMHVDSWLRRGGKRGQEASELRQDPLLDGPSTRLLYTLEALTLVSVPLGPAAPSGRKNPKSVKENSVSLVSDWIPHLAPHPWALVTPACLEQESCDICLTRIFPGPWGFLLHNCPPAASLNLLLGYKSPPGHAICKTEPVFTLRSFFLLLQKSWIKCIFVALVTAQLWFFFNSE